MDCDSTEELANPPAGTGALPHDQVTVEHERVVADE